MVHRTSLRRVECSTDGHHVEKARGGLDAVAQWNGKDVIDLCPASVNNTCRPIFSHQTYRMSHSTTQEEQSSRKIVAYSVTEVAGQSHSAAYRCLLENHSGGGVGTRRLLDQLEAHVVHTMTSAREFGAWL